MLITKHYHGKLYVMICINLIYNNFVITFLLFFKHLLKGVFWSRGIDFMRFFKGRKTIFLLSFYKLLINILRK